ncbi:MAG: M1 family metallopeptidase [Planctomycetes bacterium]|nr:M1 family metallopeptidase [Planctomycetota bacterium]
MTAHDPHSFADLAQARIEHIEFDLEVDFAARRIHGRADYLLDRAVNGSFFLDTRDLEVTAVRGGGGDLAWRLDETDRVLGTRLHVEGLRDLEAFTIEFKTAPGASALQWLAPEQTAGKQHPFLFSQCQAIHARSVFPCQDTPAVRFTYRARVKVPAPLTAVMSAARKEVRTEGAHTLAVFEMPQAIPSYLFALAAGNIADEDLGPRSRIHAEPEALEAAAREFADTERMIVEAEGLFGPYVWDRFDMLLMPPSFPYGGMENPRLTFLTPTLIVGDRSMVNVVVHELAHSWTGNLVTNATWEDFWLNEGWTVYAERRILEILEGRDYAQMKAVLRHKNMLDDMKLFGLGSDPTRLKYSQKGIDPDEVFSTIPYEKGAAFLTLLEEAAGRKRFDAFLRRYIDTFKFQSLSTEEFLAFLREHLPEAADAVAVDEWVYEPGYPEKAPVYRSNLLDTVDAALAAYAAGARPGEDAIAGWRSEQVELFLKGLPREIPPADCQYFEQLFGLATSRNNNHLTEFYDVAIRSGYEAALAGVERLLASVGRMLYLKPLYRALAGTEWTKGRTRAIFERCRGGYHPIAAGGIERILKDASL